MSELIRKILTRCRATDCPSSMMCRRNTRQQGYHISHRIRTIMPTLFCSRSSFSTLADHSEATELLGAFIRSQPLLSEGNSCDPATNPLVIEGLHRASKPTEERLVKRALVVYNQVVRPHRDKAQRSVDAARIVKALCAAGNQPSIEANRSAQFHSSEFNITSHRPIKWKYLIAWQYYRDCDANKQSFPLHIDQVEDMIVHIVSAAGAHGDAKVLHGALSAFSNMRLRPNASIRRAICAILGSLHNNDYNSSEPSSPRQIPLSSANVGPRSSSAATAAVHGSEDKISIVRSALSILSKQSLIPQSEFKRDREMLSMSVRLVLDPVVRSATHNRASQAGLARHDDTTNDNFQPLIQSLFNLCRDVGGGGAHRSDVLMQCVFLWLRDELHARVGVRNDGSRLLGDDYSDSDYDDSDQCWDDRCADEDFLDTHSSDKEGESLRHESEAIARTKATETSEQSQSDDTGTQSQLRSQSLKQLHKQSVSVRESSHGSSAIHSRSLALTEQRHIARFVVALLKSWEDEPLYPRRCDHAVQVFMRWLPECSDIFVQYLLDYEIRFVSSAGPPVQFVPFYVVGKAMRLCAYDCNWTGVEKVLEVMLRQGARPSQWALHASVVALIKLQKVESAVRLLEVMRRKGVLPNVVTFRVLCAELLRRNDLNLAERVYATAVSSLGWKAVAGFVDTSSEKSNQKKSGTGGSDMKEARPQDKIAIELTDSLLQLRTKWLVEHRLLERLRKHLTECEDYLGIAVTVRADSDRNSDRGTDGSVSQQQGKPLLSIPAFRPSQPWSSQREALFRIYNGAVCTLAADPESWDEANYLMHRMLQLGLVPSTKALDKMVDNAMKSGRTVKAAALLRELSAYKSSQ